MVNQARKEFEGISSDYNLVQLVECGGTHLNQVSPWPVQLQFMISCWQSQDSTFLFCFHFLSLSLSFFSSLLM